jgi:hypothetical protein
MNSLNRILLSRPEVPGRMRILLLMLGVLLAQSAHVRAGQSGKPALSLNPLASELKPYARALGQRVQRPGIGKIAATGTVSNPDNAQIREPIRITWESPLKIRLERNDSLLTFDRNNPTRSVFKSQEEADLVQMLLEDSADGFFALQRNRTARRFLGSGFKLEGAQESDPGVDIMMMTLPDMFQRDHSITKSFWFDSRTKLLGLVAYTSPAGILTHIMVDDWRNVEGENIPFRVERWENSKLTMQIVLDSVTVSAGADDGSLGGN